METIKKLEVSIGGRWHSVSLFNSSYEGREEFQSPHMDRFCEAVNSATINKVLLDPGKFTCPGARYAFGCGDSLKKDMFKKFVEEKGFSADYAKTLIENMPHCVDQPEAIGINLSNQPDVLIAQLQPEQVMHLLQIYQLKLEKTYQGEISSVISACGNVTVKAIQTKDLAISFGCEDARTLGGLSRDRLFAGLPYGLAKSLVTVI